VRTLSRVKKKDERFTLNLVISKEVEAQFQLYKAQFHFSGLENNCIIQ